ncbi:hypothetical protein [Ornithinimicrobium pekingense]|nr:hypothetical protein [Ornithinimicrobium pekingense]
MLRPLAAAAAGTLIVLAACDAPGSDGSSGAGSGAGSDGAGDGQGQPGGQDEPAALVATPATPEGTSLLGGEDAAARALAMSQALFTAAPVVVLTSADEQLRAASAASVLGVPVLVDGEGVAEELERLGTEVALALGPVQDPGVDLVTAADDTTLAGLLGITADPEQVDRDDTTARLAALDPGTPQLLVPGPPEESPTTGDDASSISGAPGPDLPPADRDELPATAPPEPQPGTVVLTTGEEDDVAALGTALAAGARVVHSPDGDPRATSESVQALAESAPTAVLGLGQDLGDADTLAWRVRTAATGVELPGGGQLALPDRTYVALYGTPGTGALGVLGEQPVEETVTRAEELAAAYEALTDEPVVPTLEIIVTIASAGAGADGNYSEELPVEGIRPLVDLAAEHGLYVVLDLQPGRTDFLTQAQQYQELLELPHVGLALDPEWRLEPHEVHLTQIGQVHAEEVNEVITWLADLTRERDLPQKVLVLHQFQPRMIPDIADVDLSRSELAVLIHADGQGAQPDKQQTWRALHAHAPDVEHWGWKNFYDEDVPGPLSPEETMSLVDPVPDFVSYQ